MKHIYEVEEYFYSIQGEGANVGVPAFFIRLKGCDVCCPWCDSKSTWHRGDGMMMDDEKLAEIVKDSGAKKMVITGGEPFMQDLHPLTVALKNTGIKIMVETSGTHPLSGIIDWVCLSPKRFKKPLPEAFERADEIKVVIASKEDFEWAEECYSKVRKSCKLFLQPEWNGSKQMLKEIIEYVQEHQKWRISLQTHKYMNIR